MRENSREAWGGTIATVLVLVSATVWEGFASLLISFLIMVAFSVYKSSHSSLRWQLRTVIYVIMAGILGMLDWGAINNLAKSVSPPYWNYLVLATTLVLVYLTVVWEQHRNSGHS